MWHRKHFGLYKKVFGLSVDCPPPFYFDWPQYNGVGIVHVWPWHWTISSALNLVVDLENYMADRKPSCLKGGKHAWKPEAGAISHWEMLCFRLPFCLFSKFSFFAWRSKTIFAPVTVLQASCCCWPDRRYFVDYILITNFYALIIIYS